MIHDAFFSAGPPRIIQRGSIAHHLARTPARGLTAHHLARAHRADGTKSKITGKTNVEKFSQSAKFWFRFAFGIPEGMDAWLSQDVRAPKKP